MANDPLPAHWLARLGWLRAAVLGANDGILSTAGTILAVAAATGAAYHGHTAHAVIFAGLAAWIAGACSMACGEYASVSAQADTEATAIRDEQAKLDLQAIAATNITGRPVPAGSAAAKLGLTDDLKAKPMQAAIASAMSFTAGAFFPILFTLLVTSHLILMTGLATLLALIALGAFSAWLSGGRVRKTTARVAILGVAALIITVVVGNLAGIVV